MRLSSLVVTLSICCGFPFAFAAETPSAALPEAAQKELARYRETVAKLQKSMEESVLKERARTTPVLVAVAKKSLSGGDMPGAVLAWKAVLDLDRGHQEARAFFTSVNQLDQVLAELGPAELPPGEAPKVAKPGVERTVTISSEHGKELELGAMRAGTTLLFSYAGGRWTFRAGVRDKLSPDQGDADERYRLALCDGAGKIITVIPAGTANQPASHTFAGGEMMVKLRMAHPNPPNPEGEVSYKIRMIPPTK